MEILYLVLATIAPGIYSVLSAIFARKSTNGKGAALLFNLGLCLASFLCWLIYFLCNRDFEPFVILYSLGFGVSFFLTFFFVQLAYKNGPIALTTLIVNFALIIVVVWGFIFWGAKANAFSISGMCLVVISLVLCLLKFGSKKEEGNGNKISIKWIIYVVIATLGNAAGAIVMRQEAINYAGKYTGELMLFGVMFAFVFCFIFTIIKKEDAKNTEIKTTWWMPLVSGVLSFLNTFLVLLLANTTLSSNVIYPVICIGSIFIPLIYSVIFFKEKLTIVQIIGFVIGIGGIVLLSIN